MPRVDDMEENFRGGHGGVFLVRCPSCGKENWSPAVASGQCYWCGWVERAKPKRKKNKKERRHETSAITD